MEALVVYPGLELYLKLQNYDLIMFPMEKQVTAFVM